MPVVAVVTREVVSPRSCAQYPSLALVTSPFSSGSSQATVLKDVVFLSFPFVVCLIVVCCALPCMLSCVGWLDMRLTLRHVSIRKLHVAVSWTEGGLGALRCAGLASERASWCLPPPFPPGRALVVIATEHRRLNLTTGKGMGCDKVVTLAFPGEHGSQDGARSTAIVTIKIAKGLL
ncbi:hypothetical protein B0T24DRAFT_221835 [Lasiosphaeria ovina]|uniref:Uncharacterized protein n=1 Tax=Lasiosphaeria ovina TaxID=92902 RepID=A0AAE0KHB5_9PEZI|nr:hypothetical protein B0T24DRAFT_221835 [Lasiosphaeria ovina]